ncbi:MAG: hypothetical protein K6U80_02675 [Firmicutes bacterium]|nr:hypothetical protein [Bacillota bacterium]
MDRIRKIQYKDKEIMYLDFTNLNSIKEVDQILSVIQAVNSAVSACPPKSVLTLTNIEGLFFNRDIITAFKKSQDLIKPYQKKAAVIGIHGLQKIAVEAIAALTNDNYTKTFNNELEAKEWLVE